MQEKPSSSSRIDVLNIYQGTKPTWKTKLKDFFLVFFALTTLLSLVSGYFLYTKLPSYKQSIKQDQLKATVLDLIKTDSLYNLPSQDKLDQGEIKGLVASLDDPYSEFLSKDDSQSLNDSINQNYQGIGVKLQQIEGKFVITYVFKDSPALKAGVMISDKILKVDDVDTTTLKNNELVAKIRGPENTQVKLTVERDGKPVEITITRSKLSSELLFLSFKNDTVIIEITSFGQNLDAKMSDAVAQISQKPEIKKIVLDLRSNTGGLLDQALAVASYFLESNSEVLIEKTKQDSQVYRSSYKEKNLVNYPLVVLVDDSSASASEILAGSLRDDRKVPVVGQKTYGKGVVQRIYNLDDGNEVKLTVAEWLTPKGSSINKTGLDPDIKVDPAKDSLEVGLKSF